MRLPSLAHFPEEGVILQPEYFERFMSEWTQELSAQVSVLGALLKPPHETQFELGYFHTLREICQQPLTWLETAAVVTSRRERLKAFLTDSGIFDRSGAIILTGSGSSHFVGGCLAFALQSSLGLPVQNIPSGLLLTHTELVIPPNRPCVLVSFARSGESPERV